MGRQRGTESSRKSVTDSKLTTSNTKSQGEEEIRNNLPPRPTSRNSRRVRGLSPLPPEKSPSTTGVAPAPKAKPKPKPKQKSKPKSKKPNEPSPPYPGHDPALNTTLSENPDDNPTRTEIYIDKATQSKHQDVTGEKATQTEYNDTTGEKATQTESQDISRDRRTHTAHQDVERSAALVPAAAQLVYGDPTERWVMDDSQSGQTVVADAPVNDTLSGPTTVEDVLSIEPMHGTPAYQPSPSNQTQGRKRKSSTVKESGSFTGQGTSSVPGIYRKPQFPTFLENGSLTNVQLFMKEYTETLDEEGVEDTTRDLLKNLKAESHQPADDERYKEEVLQLTMEQLEFKNEPYVVAELHDLVCPPVERLAHIYDRNVELRGTYKLFVDHRNESWRRAPQLIAGMPSPTPDYCVGFRRRAFLREELALLATVSSSTSSFAVTDHMYFPFLTCEVKSHKEPISLANKQNAYSMMVAVSSAIDLFRAAKVEQSVHRKVLGFSISYDHKDVLAYGYYPVIVGPYTEIYRTRILDFTITSGGSTKWQSWQFVRNIYEVWAPEHRERLRAAIDLLKDTVGVAGPRNRDEQTPTPSEAANRGLQQLGLQSPRLQQLAREDSVSVSSDQSRRRRAMTAPVGGDASPKRQKSTLRDTAGSGKLVVTADDTLNYIAMEFGDGSEWLKGRSTAGHALKSPRIG